MKLVAPPNSSELALIPSGDSMQLNIDKDLPVECRKLRSEVLTMLQRAAASLPDNCRLHVFEAFRSQKRQFLFWNERLIELAREFPEKVYDARALIVRCMDDIASPVDRPSGHQGGSAVDVTIFENGEPLDMGGTFKNFKTDEWRQGPVV